MQWSGGNDDVITYLLGPHHEAEACRTGRNVEQSPRYGKQPYGDIGSRGSVTGCV